MRMLVGGGGSFAGSDGSSGGQRGRVCAYVGASCEELPVPAQRASEQPDEREQPPSAEPRTSLRTLRASRAAACRLLEIWSFGGFRLRVNNGRIEPWLGIFRGGSRGDDRRDACSGGLRRSLAVVSPVRGV